MTEESETVVLTPAEDGWYELVVAGNNDGFVMISAPFQPPKRLTIVRYGQGEYYLKVGDNEEYSINPGDGVEANTENVEEGTTVTVRVEDAQINYAYLDGVALQPVNNSVSFTMPGHYTKLEISTTS